MDIRPSDEFVFPSDADYCKRVDRAQASMKENGIDVLAVSGFDNLRFFTGLNGMSVGRPIWLVLLQSGAPAFVSPRSEATEIRARCGTPVAVEWGECEEPVPALMTHEDALAKYIGDMAPNARTIGVDFNSTWALNIELVKQALGAARVKDATPMVRELFARKDAALVAVLRCCAVVLADEAKACMNAVAPGVLEYEVRLAAIAAGARCAAKLWGGNENQSPIPQGLFMGGAGAKHTSSCHPPGGVRAMKDGELYEQCLCGSPFFGHSIGYDRPIAVGSKPLSADLRNIVDVARKAQEAALANVRPGVAAGDVHAAVEVVIKDAGFDASVLQHRTGRGIGVCDFDGLELKAGSTTVLEPGMVMTVEPGLYVDGVGGARFGDTVLVTETGHEVLTPFKLGRDI